MDFKNARVFSRRFGKTGYRTQHPGRACMREGLVAFVEGVKNGGYGPRNEVRRRCRGTLLPAWHIQSYEGLLSAVMTIGRQMAAAIKTRLTAAPYSPYNTFSVRPSILTRLPPRLPRALCPPLLSSLPRLSLSRATVCLFNRERPLRQGPFIYHLPIISTVIKLISSSATILL